MVPKLFVVLILSEVRERERERYRERDVRSRPRQTV